MHLGSDLALGTQPCSVGSQRWVGEVPWGDVLLKVPREEVEHQMAAAAVVVVAAGKASHSWEVLQETLERVA